MTPPAFRRRISLVAFCFLGCATLGLLRCAQLTYLQSEWLRDRAQRQQVQRVKLAPERGPIVDRNGEVLALSVRSAAVYLRPRLFEAVQVARVARHLGLSESFVASRAASASPFVWLQREVSLDVAQELERLRIPGLGVELGWRRDYPRGPLAGIVVGTSGIDLEGLAGVEKSYDADLRGREQAVQVGRDARGRRFLRDPEEISWREPGARVELTIDATLQEQVETALADAVTNASAAAGNVVVMDPRNGEILALAQYPPFDPRQRALARTETARNRAITDTFEPGSTFKALVAAAGLEEGVVRPQDSLDCERGSYAIGKRVVHDHHRYGMLSFSDVIRHSSNIGTAKVGERLGAERLSGYLRQFGLHRVTGIDLPGEKSYPLRPWERWARINLVTISFGQGIAITPIQLVTAYGALANGGDLIRPHVVRRVLRADGSLLRDNAPEVSSRPISEETARQVSEMLQGVVESGTGTKAKVALVPVAGKTGTAQKVDPATGRYSARDRISSFIGYLPANDPRFVILVVIDTPRTATYGGIVAAPAFRQIAEFGVDRLGLRMAAEAPQAPVVAAAPAAPPVRPVHWEMEDAVPDLKGLSLREALVRAQREGWQVRTEGSGFVVSQERPTAADGSLGRVLELRLRPAGQGRG